MIIPPRHLALSEIERALGLSKEFDNWKIELVNLINEFKNDFPDKEPPILWDFSLINDITTEKLPENNIENMIWFRDRIHFRKKLGDHVLDIIFANNDKENLLKENIGVRIDTLDIYDYLIEYENNNAEYRMKSGKFIEKLKINVNQTMNLYNN